MILIQHARSLFSRLTLGLLLLPAFESTSLAEAGSQLVIKEIGIAQGNSTIAWVEVIGTVGAPINCTNEPGHPTLNGFAFDYSTDKGKAILQLLTAAHLSGKRVTIIGGACLVLSRAFQPTTNASQIIQLQVID